MNRLVFLPVIVLLFYSSMFDKITVPNERTRVYLSVALVDDFSLSIDNSVQRFGKTVDIAEYDGRYFTDKAPGASFLGAVVYGTARIFSPKRSWTIEDIITLMRRALMIPIGLAGFFLLRRFLSNLKICNAISDIVSVSWILGTSAFHYSTVFYGHQIAAVALMSAMYLQLPNENGRKRLRLLLSGFAAGLAGITEYQSIVPCSLLFFFLVYQKRRNPKEIVLFVLGAAPFAILLLLYNKYAFGNCFALPYENLVSSGVQALHNTGVAGVSFPKADAVFGSMFSMNRGLLSTSPTFILVPLGLYYMARTKNLMLAVLIGSIFVYYLLFIFSAKAWYAGWSFGPRLLVPVMAIAMIPCAFAVEYLSKFFTFSSLARGLMVAGICYHQIVQAVFAELPEHMKNPLPDLIIPALKRGLLSPNIAAAVTNSPGLWTLTIPAFAVLVVVLFVLLRENSPRRILSKASLKQSILKVVIGTIPSAAILSAIMLWGSTISYNKTDKFLNWMENLQNAQFND